MCSTNLTNLTISITGNRNIVAIRKKTKKDPINNVETVTLILAAERNTKEKPFYCFFFLFFFFLMG